MPISKFKVSKLDARFNYNKYFSYMIEMTGQSSAALRAIEFNRAKQWFEKTYGYSAEVRAWVDIVSYYNFTQAAATLWRKRLPMPVQSDELPKDIVSEHWSWTNGRDGGDLRIYCATDKEVAFFKLAHKVDQ